MARNLLITFIGLTCSTFTFAQKATFTWGGVIPLQQTTLSQSIEFDHSKTQEENINKLAESTYHLSVEKMVHEGTNTEIQVLTAKI